MSLDSEIVHLSFSSAGGAGSVARQLNGELVRRGIRSSHLFAIDSTLRTNPFAAPREALAAGVDEFLVKRQGFENPISLVRSWPSSGDMERIPEGAIVHIHWAPGVLGSRFSDLESKAKGVVVTLHDFLPITGACHYPSDCRSFRKSCESCPAVRDIFQKEVQERRKLREQLVSSPKVVFTAPTQSAADLAASNLSLDKPIHVIQNPVGHEFKLLPRNEEPLNSELHIAIIAADLSDNRKGVAVLLSHLVEVRKERKLHLHLVGSGSNWIQNRDWVTKHGHLSASKLAEVLAKCHLHMLGSVEEVAGLVVSEAAACGVPTLARKGTGAEDLIKVLGFGDVFDDDSLIYKLVEFQHLSASDRLKISELSKLNFGISEVTNIFQELYRTT